LEVGGRTYAVAVRPAGRSSPILNINSRVQLLIDADRDGHFRERGVLDAQGHALPSEEIRLDRPFSLDGTRLVATALEEHGGRLRLRRSTVVIAPVVGFMAPPLHGRGVDGRAHSLDELRGKVVLLTFWATYCPWSERVRPTLDSLAVRLGDSSFVWVAMARDDDREVIRAHVASHPMLATVLVHDSTSWAEFNPSTITPLFYLIDRGGTVRLVERAAAASSLVVREATREVHGR
jgi:thiol-disulfide isomerase/thioredoxin